MKWFLFYGWIQDLVSVDAVGERLVISGTVYAADCTTPLEGALVEVWHADSDGVYGDFRGEMMTDSNGHYQLTTIRPGNYGEGADTRASHIHVRVGHADGQPVETEIVLGDDPYAEEDPVVIGSLIVPLTVEQGSEGRFARGTFDVILKPPLPWLK